jgi:hypothetical protein
MDRTYFFLDPILRLTEVRRMVFLSIIPPSTLSFTQGCFHPILPRDERHRTDHLQHALPGIPDLVHLAGHQEEGIAGPDTHPSTGQTYRD